MRIASLLAPGASGFPGRTRTRTPKDFLHAKMDADAAERAQIDATREMARLSDVKKLVVAARNSVQRASASWR